MLIQLLREGVSRKITSTLISTYKTVLLSDLKIYFVRNLSYKICDPNSNRVI